MKLTPKMKNETNVYSKLGQGNIQYTMCIWLSMLPKLRENDTQICTCITGKKNSSLKCDWIK